MSSPVPDQMTKTAYRRVILQYLAQGDKKKAAALLWPWIVQNEQSDRIWREIEENTHLAIMGHASASKTFTCAQYMLMEWWTCPHETAVLITSDTLASMQRRVWTDIKTLWNKAVVKMPGFVVDSKRVICYSPLDTKNAIAAIAAESDDATSKIQGVHTKRVFVLIDEADNKQSQSVWAALPNLESSGTFKVVALANPIDRQSIFAQHCEPEGGWSTVNPDSDKAWTSRAKWRVIRLDALDSPNIKAGSDIFPFLFTNKALASIRDKNTENSKEWWAYVRAMYPPEGAQNNIFTSDIILKANFKHTWYSLITPCGACDPAFATDGDDCILYFGLMGRLAATPEKTGLQTTERVKLHRKNLGVPVTIDYADQIIDECKKRGVAPENFAIDMTGESRGLADIITHKWGGILCVDFRGSATEMKVVSEDSLKACDRYDRFVSELWYVAREWTKLGLVAIFNPVRELIIQLEGRLYSLVGKGKISVEKKTDFKARLGQSPDDGDAFCLLVHLVRTRAMNGAPSILNRPTVAKDSLAAFRKGARIDKMNYGVKSS